MTLKYNFKSKVSPILLHSGPNTPLSFSASFLIRVRPLVNGPKLAAPKNVRVLKLQRGK
jgi:hypothetical protein